MRFSYARRGGPLLDWSGPTPPSPTRAGETRSLGDFYPTQRSSNALRRYGGVRDWPGGAKGYEHDRALGYWGSAVGYGGAGYRPAPGLGSLDIPRPGAPEVVEGYESPAPGAAIVHLGGNYMPEGAARSYGQTMLSADAPPPPAKFDMGLVRKASALAAAYHGVKRNNGSILWGLLWAAAAFVAPLYGTLVPAFAVAQGFGQSKGPRQNPAMGTAQRRARKRMQARWRRKKRVSKRKTVKRRKQQRTKRWGTRRGY